MTELVLAVFNAASAADAAVQDIAVARIPSGVIQEDLRGQAELGHRVTVAVNETHAAAVMKILNKMGRPKSKSASPKAIVARATSAAAPTSIRHNTRRSRRSLHWWQVGDRRRYVDAAFRADRSGPAAAHYRELQQGDRAARQ